MLDCDRMPMNANLTLNAINANLALNIMNTNLTFNAINTSVIECRSVHYKVRYLNDKVKSMNVEVVTAKNITSNCTNSKSICNTKCFQTCATSTGTVRSRYVKFLCGKNPQNQLIFIGNYQDNNCLCCRHQCEQEPSRIPGKKICRLLTKSRKFRKAILQQCSKACTFKYLNHNHMVNYSKLSLSGDIETNPRTF